MAMVKQDHMAIIEEINAFKMVENGNSPPTWQALQVACAELSKILLAHIKREKRSLAKTGHSLGAELLDKSTQPAVDHYGDYRYLQVISRCVALEHRPFLLNSRYHMLKNFLQELKRHLDQQEKEFFQVEFCANGFQDSKKGEIWKK